jgi:hypothetical protein
MQGPLAPQDWVVASRRRALRPGGVLLIQIAAYEWLRSGYDDSVGTAHRYTADSVQELLQNEGFVVEHLTYRVTALFPQSAARRWGRRRPEAG